MGDIFISYSHRDKARAEQFAHIFAALGLSVWWDVGLRTGEAFDEAIERALRAASVVVVLWSPHSVESRWVRAEAMFADRCKTLLPVMIAPCDRPIIFELTHTAELAHWHGAPDDPAWQAFIADVQRMIAAGAKAAARAPAVPHAAPPPAPGVNETLRPGQNGSAPSLAVLPFANRSGVGEDEVFAEAMVEDVISALSQGVNVRVLGAATTARLSRSLRADPVALGRQLGVRYLLEGNVRRIGSALRVTTQLLEAAAGEVVWTGRFDRPLAELAELQEDLVNEVAATLDTQVYSLEMDRALRKPADITAWEAVARSLSAYRGYDAAALQRATGEAERAIAIAPDYGPGHAALANALANAYFSSGRDDPEAVARIRAIADHALALGPDDVTVLAYCGLAYCFIGLPADGERCTARALHKTPGSGLWHFYHGIACIMRNQPEASLRHFGIADRLMHNSHMLWGLRMWRSVAHREAGDLAAALQAADESIALIPTFAQNFVYRAYLCAAAGDDAGARAAITRALTLGTKAGYAERFWRRMAPGSPRLDVDTAIIRALYAATETAA